MILIVDNYDSFTYNLVQAVGAIDPDIVVVRNDRFEPDEALDRKPDAVIVSPGPGRPEGAGRTMPLILEAERRGIPLLGVCLGHQAIGACHGAVVERAPQPRHGKSSTVHHDGTGLFDGIDAPFEAARYHSLVVREDTLPPEIAVTARSADGLVMALAHRSRPVFGLQFHPESVLTLEGPAILANFLRLAGR
ncbi:MAG: aminodeoxychorismate/anthranilate synthase component II [Acidobacteriota bacterium]|nr:aminodeoxychorismate/anthranilate synthase component II [Acidobacteriota bacterium]